MQGFQLQKSEAEEDRNKYPPLPTPERVSNEVIGEFNRNFKRKFNWHLTDLAGNKLKIVKCGPDREETGNKHLDDIIALQNIKVIKENEDEVS